MTRHCHCRDYSRSELMRRAAAQAGRGLPQIETGMPLPAGTGLSRRSFLSRSAGLALAVYGATKLPLAAFEAVKEAYPRNEVTLRQAVRVVRRRERPGTPRHADADPGSAQ